MPEPMPEGPKTDELHPELVLHQGASGSNPTDCLADDVTQTEPALPAAKLLTDGHGGVSLAMEHAGCLAPEDSHILQSEVGGSSTNIAVQNNQTYSLESQEPRANKMQEMLGGITGGVPEDAPAHPAPLSYDEPGAELTADNGIPECTSKPDPVLPSDVGHTEATEAVCRLPAANSSGDSCQIDLPALAGPTTDDGDGNSSQPVGEPAAATQTLADHTRVAVVPTEVTAEAVHEPSSSTAGTSGRTPADGSGDPNAQLHVNSAEPEQVSTKTSEADTCRSVSDDMENVQAVPSSPLSSGDQAEPAVPAAKEDMDILGNGKLVKKVIRAGKGSHTRPQYGSQVTIKYEGQLPNGVVVDEATELSFILHDGDVIAALDLAVALMELGEECQLQTAPDYAYKGIGRHPDIPPDVPMTYTIELLSVSEPPIVSELPVEQIIALADKKRDRGNYLYSRTEYDNAIVCYTRAVQIADDPDIRSEDTHKLQMLLDLRLKCYNNLAATQVKAKQYEAAVDSCEKVLKIEPLNVKALFRKGKSLGAMGSTKEAIEILKQALKREPSTKVIHRELYKLQEKLKKDAEDEKSLYKKMMGLKKTASGTASGGLQGDGKQQSSRAATYGIVGAVAAVALSIGVFMLRKYL